MARVPQWESNFANWVEKAMGRSFQYGVFDCALMAGEVIELMRGSHPEPELVGACHSPVGAYRILRRMGGLSGIMDKYLNRTESSTRGDIHLCDCGRVETLAIDVGRRLLVMGSPRPVLVNKETMNTKTIWRTE